MTYNLVKIIHNSAAGYLASSWTKIVVSKLWNDTIYIQQYPSFLFFQQQYFLILLITCMWAKMKPRIMILHDNNARNR